LGDGGGLTRLGLTQRWHQTGLPTGYFSTMSFSDAVAAAKITYKYCYWDMLDGDAIMSDQVAAPLLSFAVNDSVKVAVETLQRVLEVEIDGFMGPKTVAELNSKDPYIAAKLFRAGWVDFYHNDVIMNPAKQKFLTGWVNRALFPYPSPYSVEAYQ
jgi:lysozyme family protein